MTVAADQDNTHLSELLFNLVVNVLRLDTSGFVLAQPSKAKNRAVKVHG